MLSSLVLLTALAWTYLFYDAQRMSGMDMGMMGEMAVLQPWHPIDLLLLFAMWGIMMVGMMIPTASPTVLLFARVNRMRSQAQRPYAPTGTFVLGYVAAWILFSLIATATQALLHTSALLSPMMVSESAILGGSILVAAGIFQWTPLKDQCLIHCRASHAFLAAYWREGTYGALAMGLRHGLYCVGCCWVLMALLFVTGVMNLVWVAILTVFVLLEKVVPSGLSSWVTRGTGVALFVWGLSLLYPSI